MILADRFHYSQAYLDQCAGALTEALERTPFYSSWRRYDPGPGAGLDARYDALPALTKADMRRAFPAGLVPEGRDVREGLKSEEIEYTFTSGTTSEKVVNLWCPAWWNASEAASWKLNGTLASLSWPQRQAKLASALNVGISCEEDLPMDHRILGDTLYLNEKTSVLQWQDRHLRRMAEELSAWRPAILEANPSLLARLAFWAEDRGVALYSPRAVVFTFEYPSALHRAAVRRAMPAAAQVSSYGSTETGFVLESCGEGRMHQNTAFCRIDFQPLAPRWGLPDVGRILVTPFGNPWSRVLRFDVGDLVRLPPPGSCPCGRTEGFEAEAVEGRVSNVTFRTDGGLVTTRTLDGALTAVPGLRDYHLEQTAPARYALQLLSAPGADRAAAERAVREALRRVYGGGDFDVAFTDDILPGPAGKFRRTQTNFEFDERRLFA